MFVNFQKLFKLILGCFFEICLLSFCTLVVFGSEECVGIIFLAHTYARCLKEVQGRRQIGLSLLLLLATVLILFIDFKGDIFLFLCPYVSLCQFFKGLIAFS